MRARGNAAHRQRGREEVRAECPQTALSSSGRTRPSSCAALATSRLRAISAARSARRAALRFRADCGADLRPLPPRVTDREETKSVVGRAVARATPRRTQERPITS